MQVILFLSVEICFHSNSTAQLFSDKNNSSLADSLRGTLSDARRCYDVTFYHLDLKIDTSERSISGFNKVFFVITKAAKTLQLDLFDNMPIRKIILDDTTEVTFNRLYHAVFVNFTKELPADSRHSLTIHYSGKPVEGKMLPWDGGFTWTRDKLDNPLIAVACQGVGASLWWPNKDHQSDEPDSMQISISVPVNLMAISNGRLRGVKELRGGYHRYDWFVSYPINNYNVTLNIGKYGYFSDYHINHSDTLTLDYYVLPYNLEKAQRQFSQVKPMLNCFEKYFGKYPFYRDGYKLIETPYLGMEHQSAISYGNNYLNGYRGSDYSTIGLEFDYIIIHESAHEWWGNNVTAKDIGDMWIHEGFASYAEMLYVGCMFDSAKASQYANKQKLKIENDRPVIGPYGINKEGSGDMYSKGLMLLNTLRHVISNDSVWFYIIKKIQENYSYKTVTTTEIENFISETAHMDLQHIFDQYLRNTDIPVLEIKITKKGNPFVIEYKWNKVVKGFNMPVCVNYAQGQTVFIQPTEEWQSMRLIQNPAQAFKITENLFYIIVKME